MIESQEAEVEFIWDGLGGEIKFIHIFLGGKRISAIIPEDSMPGRPIPLKIIADHSPVFFREAKLSIANWKDLTTLRIDAITVHADKRTSELSKGEMVDIRYQDKKCSEDRLIRPQKDGPVYHPLIAKRHSQMIEIEMPSVVQYSNTYQILIKKEGLNLKAKLLNDKPKIRQADKKQDNEIILEILNQTYGPILAGVIMQLIVQSAKMWGGDELDDAVRDESLDKLKLGVTPFLKKELMELLDHEHFLTESNRHDLLLLLKCDSIILFDVLINELIGQEKLWRIARNTLVNIVPDHWNDFMISCLAGAFRKTVTQDLIDSRCQHIKDWKSKAREALTHEDLSMSSRSLLSAFMLKYDSIDPNIVMPEDELHTLSCQSP